MPFSRAAAPLVYQRAKGARQAAVRHPARRLRATATNGCTIRCSRRMLATHDFRVADRRPGCTQPYSASSVFNISAMSFGALSANAIRALNAGAKKGDFAHDTGEGGVSPYHRENGGDLIWEIGSGYFGCRNATAASIAERFAANAPRSADQDDRAQAQPGRQARPWRRAAGGQGDARDRRGTRRADGRGLHLAGARTARSRRRSR